MGLWLNDNTGTSLRRRRLGCVGHSVFRRRHIAFVFRNWPTWSASARAGKYAERHVGSNALQSLSCNQWQKVLTHCSRWISLSASHPGGALSKTGTLSFAVSAYVPDPFQTYSWASSLLSIQYFFHRNRTLPVKISNTSLAITQVVKSLRYTNCRYSAFNTIFCGCLTYPVFGFQL